jgi:sigma-E factor negative regulatory protein RseC
MLEESGTVVAVDEQTVWVQTQIKTTCGQCQAKDNCGTGAVAKAFSPKTNVIAATIPAEQDWQIEVGDSVTIGIEENFVLLSAFYVYILPIAGFMVFAGLGEVLFSGSVLLTGFGFFTDLFLALWAFFGGWLGYLLARKRLGTPSGEDHEPVGEEHPYRKKCLNNNHVRLLAVNNQHIPISLRP